MDFAQAQANLDAAIKLAKDLEFIAKLKQRERDNALLVAGADPNTPPCSTLIEEADDTWFNWCDAEWARQEAFKVAAKLAP